MKSSKATIFFLFLVAVIAMGAKLPELDAPKTRKKVEEILHAHAVHKELSSLVMSRALQNFLEELDPSKSYFIEAEIVEYLQPDEALVKKAIQEFQQNRFFVFHEMYHRMLGAIERKHAIDQEIASLTLPTNVTTEEFWNLKWAKNEDELTDRHLRLRALQKQAFAKLAEELRETSLQRVIKRQTQFEQDLFPSSKEEKEKVFLSKVIKAIASALDSHTMYFTPGEAAQFLINVQQRLFGIGAQLRDDVDGFTVVKIVDGGPAAQGKKLKAKDKIIAIDSEPVVGMDITSAVDLIRGEEHTLVTLTVIRQEQTEEGRREYKLDIPIPRGEVVLKEARYGTSTIPYGDGVIAHLRLHSFYQDPGSSSAADLTRALRQMKKESRVKGVILDLRDNSGGMLTQAVAVTGMFIKKGIVVSIKDDGGHLQHLRDLDSRMVWDGPLLVLINRRSASASEIVAQALQDYGRAIVIGDDRTFGKGSFQTFGLQGSKAHQVNPQGEYKVTKGRYYTVSGKTPQLEGVPSDICVPGSFCEAEIGERFGKYPLESDQIKPNFDDDLADIPYLQRDRVRMLYKFDLQSQLTVFTNHLTRLKKNTEFRMQNGKNYQNFLTEIRKKGPKTAEKCEKFGKNDLQLTESINVMKDLILILQETPETDYTEGTSKIGF